MILLYSVSGSLNLCGEVHKHSANTEVGAAGALSTARVYRKEVRGTLAAQIEAAARVMAKKELESEEQRQR
jgi:hypothetical protein